MATTLDYARPRQRRGGWWIWFVPLPAAACLLGLFFGSIWVLSEVSSYADQRYVRRSFMATPGVTVIELRGFDDFGFTVMEATIQAKPDDPDSIIVFGHLPTNSFTGSRHVRIKRIGPLSFEPGELDLGPAGPWAPFLPVPVNKAQDVAANYDVLLDALMQWPAEESFIDAAGTEHHYRIERLDAWMARPRVW